MAKKRYIREEKENNRETISEKQNQKNEMWKDKETEKESNLTTIKGNFCQTYSQKKLRVYKV